MVKRIAVCILYKINNNNEYGDYLLNYHLVGIKDTMKQEVILLYGSQYLLCNTRISGCM